MIEGGYADISGGFSGSPNSLQDILSLLQGQKSSGPDISSQEPYKSPVNRGVEVALGPETRQFMNTPYTPPQAPTPAPVSGGNIFNTKFVDRYSDAAKGPLDPNQHVAGMPLGFKPGLQGMQSPSQMTQQPTPYGGGVVSLNQQAPAQPVARPAPVVAAPAARKLSPAERNYQEGLATRAKLDAKYEKMRARAAKTSRYYH